VGAAGLAVRTAAIAPARCREWKGADPLAYVVHIRLLGCEFEIRTNSGAVRDAVSRLTQHARQDVPVVERNVMTVTWTGDEFHIGGADLEDDFELSSTAAVETLFQHLHSRAFAMLPHHIRISAASGVHAGGSFLITGPPRAGKTTLAVSLMLEGLDITGDALVLLSAGEALPFPRKFHVREESIARISKLRAIERFACCSSNPQEGRLVALDPLEFGKPWRIAPAAVSTVFYLEPNHGGETTLRRTGKLEMIRRVLPHCAPPSSGRRDWLGELCATIDRADTFVIEFGELAAAVSATISVLRRADLDARAVRI
jgi:hypothetical protein